MFIFIYTRNGLDVERGKSGLTLILVERTLRFTFLVVVVSFEGLGTIYRKC